MSIELATFDELKGVVDGGHYHKAIRSNRIEISAYSLYYEVEKKGTLHTSHFFEFR